jgi:hypothetical protein
MLFTTDYKAFADIANPTKESSLTPLYIYLEAVEKTKVQVNVAMANAMTKVKELHLNMQYDAHPPVWFRGYLNTIPGDKELLPPEVEQALQMIFAKVAGNFGKTPIVLNVANYLHGDTLPQMIILGKENQDKKEMDLITHPGKSLKERIEEGKCE